MQDGTIDKNDLRGAFDNVGVLMTEVIKMMRIITSAHKEAWKL